MTTLEARLTSHYRPLLATAALVIIAAGIREAAEVLNSILLAMLLTVTVVPAFERLRRRGVGTGLAVVLTSLLLVVVLLALLATLGLSGTRLVQVLPHYQDRAQAMQRGIEQLLLSRGIEPARVLSLDVLQPKSLFGLAAGVLSGLGRVLSQALLLILIVAFFLAERGTRRQILNPDGTAARVATDVRQYLIITALTGLGFSLAIYALMLAIGTDLPLVWAVLAFIMNFVPNIGIILSVVPPALLTLLEHGWQRAVVIVAGFLVLNFIVDNVIKPRFMQSGLDLPPLASLLSLVIWAYLLGPVGTLLAVPLTLAIRRVLLEEDSAAAPTAT
ncbi:MAG: AI-2E family transporter [Gemmatimonadales bacterium]